MALYVSRITSFSLPQVVPDSAFKMLFLDWSLVLRLEVCCLKERRLSYVMPRNLGFLTVGTISSSISIFSTLLQSCDHVENSEAEDLEGEIKAGRFREDLFYRLNVLPIHTPPLRDRSEDLSILIDNFAKQLSKGVNKPVMFADCMMDAFKQCWQQAVLAVSSVGSKQCWQQAVLAVSSVGSSKQCWQ